MKISKKILSMIMVLLLVVGMVPISAIAADTGETYTLTIKYAITSSNGVAIGDGIADEQITNIPPNTMMDLSDYWPSALSVDGSDGKTYYFAGFVENSNGDGTPIHFLKVESNKTLYAGWTLDSQVSISLDTNGGILDCKAIRYPKKFANIDRMNDKFVPVRDGYTFLGWSLEDDGTADDPNIEITEDCTLYAVWEKVHSHCVCGGNTNIGDHTSHSDIEFTPWDKTDSMPTDAGNYVLMDNVTLSSDWKPADDTVLCLNGHTLSVSVVDVVYNYKFTLCDCGDGKITTGESTSAEVIYLYADSTFNMYGGIISSGNDRRGVYVANAWFNMYGGCITGNATDENGAGVYLYGVAKMTMYGGTITENRSTQGIGGGVWSDNTASIKLSGDAVITGNTGKDGTNNLHLASDGTTDAKITVGELGSNASIGVSVDSGHGKIISDGGKNYADKFFSDNGAYAIAVDGENLKLVEKTVQVGMVTLGNGEYTTNGKDKTEGKPTGTGYAHFENGVLTLNNFTYSGGGGNNAAIYCEYALTIKVEGENKIERVKTDADTHTTYTIRGIWSNNYLKIIGDDRNDFLEVVASGHDDAFAVAIGGDWQGIVIENCTLEAKSLTGGKGLDLAGDLTITGSKVISTSSATVGDINTQGIYAETLKVTDSDVVGIATDAADGEADGIYLDGDTAKLIFVSGSIIAETSDGASGRYAIYVYKNNSVELPTTYWMRTSASGDFAEGTWDGANVGPYFELTTTEHHTCDYTYNVNVYTITESCTCGHSATAEIVKDYDGTAIYNGSAYGAKVVYADNWAGDKVTELKYYKEQINDGNLVTNCIDAGDYFAVLTVEGATADWSFAISQKEPEISIKPAVSNIVVNSKLSDISLNGGTVLGIDNAELKGEFAWKEPTTVMDTVGSQTVKVVFTPEDENYRVQTFELEVNVVNCDTASGEHDFTEQMNNADEHWTICAKCQAEKPNSREAHKGGTATCTERAKCSECGEAYGDYGSHNWDADWKTDSEKHWHKCLNTNCTEIKDDNPHSGGSATCKDLAKCEFCDMAYGELGAHGDTEIKNAKTASCTEEGYTGDTHCKVCGEMLEKGTAIAKTAHTYENGKCTVCDAADPNYVPDSPQTGDNSNMALWLALLFISGMGLIGTTIYGRKKRTN